MIYDAKLITEAILAFGAMYLTMVAFSVIVGG
jgi:hypothetical protein